MMWRTCILSVFCLKPVFLFGVDQRQLQEVVSPSILWVLGIRPRPQGWLQVPLPSEP